MFGIGTQEIIFIVLIVLLFFGGKKIPELMKGLGKGVRSFKEGVACDFVCLYLSESLDLLKHNTY